MIEITNEPTHLATGTATVGVTFDKGLVLAADKRAAMGNYISDKQAEKIFLISDRIALTIAGGAGDGQAVARLMRAELELFKYSKGDKVTINSAANLLSNILQGNKYFPYFVHLIIGGVDVKPGLYDVDAFGGLATQKYTSTGSGSPVAISILDSEWKEGMGKEEATKLAVKAINAAMKRDAFVGEGIDVMVITPEAAKRLTKSEVAAITPPATA